MVNEKSLANLEKGRREKHARGRKAGSGGKTWAEIISEYGATTPPAEFVAQFGKTATWKYVVVAAAFRHAAAGNAAILRELMQRSEPQDENAWIYNVDMSKLSAEQIGRLADGEDPRSVILATSGAG